MLHNLALYLQQSSSVDPQGNQKSVAQRVSALEDVQKLNEYTALRGPDADLDLQTLNHIWIL